MGGKDEGRRQKDEGGGMQKSLTCREAGQAVQLAIVAGNGLPRDCCRKLSRMSETTYDPLYLQGIEHFNVCDFFEAHEVWEELWTDYHGESRKFYQGLIQVAVALHHYGNGNIRGAKKLFLSSTAYLTPYRPRHMGLDLDKFLGQFAACFSEVLANQEEFPKLEINAELIPEIHLEDD